MSYGSFNAQEIQPNQGGGTAHPVGIFVGTIADTAIKPTQANNGGMFVVSLKSNVGSIDNRYNLWNDNQDAVRISREQLSALCHAINYFHLNFDADQGAAIRGAPLMFEVGPQMVPSDPSDKRSQKVPSPTLTEVKRVFSAAGINPAKPGDAPVVPTEGAPAAQAPAQQPAAPFPQTAAPSPAAAPAAAPAAPWQQAQQAAPAAAPGGAPTPPWLAK